jgi:Recombination endonuclease VII
MNVNQLIRQRQLKKFGRYRLHRHGLTDHLFEEMLARQHGVCGICSGGSADTLVIDHCHKTKRVRGLLCNTCNLAIAYFKDNVEFLQKAIDYLKR